MLTYYVHLMILYLQHAKLNCHYLIGLLSIHTCYSMEMKSRTEVRLNETHSHGSLSIWFSRPSRFPLRLLRFEPENQSKPEYIFGVLFGGLAVVASRMGDGASIVAIPLILQLQHGISYMLRWLDMVMG